MIATAGWMRGSVTDRSNLTVLVLDDEAFVRRAAEVILQRLGIGTVVPVGTVTEAMDRLKSGVTPDVALVDLNLPGEDGLSFLGRVAEAGLTLPILFFSDVEGRLLRLAEDVAASRGLPVVGSIAKPLTPATLTRHLDMLDGLKSEIAAPKEPRDRPAFDVADFRRGLAAEEFRMHFQPKVRVSDGTFVGVESLIRWDHPEHGFLMPDAFIPLVEEKGLMGEMTDMVVHSTLSHARAWQQEGVSVQLAFNLSVSLLERTDLPSRLVDLVARYGLPNERITVELTESTLMREGADTLETLLRLKMLGFRLSIDDFGTGFSGMDQLKRVPFSEFKIDGSFVRDSARSPEARAILEKSRELAAMLDLTAVAEGVETADAWDLIGSLGYDVAQGYYIARPMPGPEIVPWARAWAG